MAKSKSRKDREKLAKQGKHDPGASRLSWGIFDGVTKMTPTKKEKLNKLGNKYKRDYSRADYNGA
ncbi:hypothetical protein D3C71_1132330 [compost metagenome]